ncbi:hypothetical protein ONE63_003219 [Megalurothrips usitatus]|uniref:Aminopeptidase N-like N-terminal domain-containing protein n=1 Tax=Megalurothrips usitatus TaxID=439358 RepID=A0AAV7X6M5_9NEOP|nr:hypothetical protein ONE63_003219 [Megalurothrips usitatus]
MSPWSWLAVVVLVAARAASPEAADPYRLPASVVPFRYNVLLQVDVDGGRYRGVAQIYVNVLADTDSVTLHAAPRLRFQSSAVAVQRYKPRAGERPVVRYSVVAIDGRDADETVTLYLSAPLERGKHYVITFSEFDADLGSEPAGFHLASYRDGLSTRRFAMTSFKPTHARKAFPCFDEPGFRARFEVKIACHRRFAVRSSMPGEAAAAAATAAAVVHRDGVQDHGGDLLRDLLRDLDPEDTTVTSFDTTVPMPTYLLAWVVSDFANLTLPTR